MCSRVKNGNKTKRIFRFFTFSLVNGTFNLLEELGVDRCTMRQVRCLCGSLSDSA